jgi:fatty acid desaturase
MHNSHSSEEAAEKETIVRRAYPQPATRGHAPGWWVLMLRGLLAILFGLAALFWPSLILAVLIVLLGAYALVDGIWPSSPRSAPPITVCADRCCSSKA